MEEIVGQLKWTITNHTKDLSSSKEDVMYMVEFVEVFYYELLLENKILIPASVVLNYTNWKQHLTKSIHN